MKNIGIVLGVVGFAVACGGKGTNPLSPGSPNHPPNITRVTLVGHDVAGHGTSHEIRVEVSDPDGDPVTCTYRPEGGTVLVDGSHRDSCITMYVAPTTGTADHVDVTASDPHGASTSSTATLALGPQSVPSRGDPGPGPGNPPPGPSPRPRPTATPSPQPTAPPTPMPTPTPTPAPTPPPNRPPTVSLSGPGTCHPTPATPCSSTISASASDPDGDPLTYTWGGCCSGSGVSSSCSVPGLQVYACSVRVSDGRGGSASDSRNVQGVNQVPTLSYDNPVTYPPRGATILRFDVTDDDPASTGSCRDFGLGGDIGTVGGCDHLGGNAFRIRLDLTSTGIGDLLWSYRDQWGAEAVGSIQVRVQY